MGADKKREQEDKRARERKKEREQCFGTEKIRKKERERNTKDRKIGTLTLYTCTIVKGRHLEALS